MADCINETVDSNITGLSIAEEVCLKQLPNMADDGYDPVWYGIEPNSYDEFGGELTTVARSPIDPSRQNKKGAVTDLDASGGFNTDFTKSNLTRFLQGFFFADARQNADTAPFNGTQNVVTGVTTADSTYAVDAGGSNFVTNSLIFASNMGMPSNNGLKLVASSTSGTIVVTGTGSTLVDETPPANAKIELVGHEFADGSVDIDVLDGITRLVSGSVDLTTIPGLFVGKWVFIGGDPVTSRFQNNVGYGRISVIQPGALTFDDTTFTGVDELGTGKLIQIFHGTVIRNEKDKNLIKRRSYHVERLLGEGANGTQGEYLKGSVPNEMTLNVPSADKLNIDLSYVACDDVYFSGDPGDEQLDGERVPPPSEEAYNTSSDIYRMKMHVHNPSTSNPTPLFGYVLEGNISLSNGVTPRKAVGVLGAFEVSTANFVVSGSVTAYFSTVAAVKAVRANADVGLSFIGAADNAGFIFDIPLLGLGGGRLNVEKDTPITVPLDIAAAENKWGYTMLHEVFSYLPTVAMPG